MSMDKIVIQQKSFPLCSDYDCTLCLWSCLFPCMMHADTHKEAQPYTKKNTKKSKLCGCCCLNCIFPFSWYYPRRRAKFMNSLNVVNYNACCSDGYFGSHCLMMCCYPFMLLQEQRILYDRQGRYGSFTNDNTNDTEDDIWFYCCLYSTMNDNDNNNHNNHSGCGDCGDCGDCDDD